MQRLRNLALDYQFRIPRTGVISLATYTGLGTKKMFIKYWTKE